MAGALAQVEEQTSDYPAWRPLARRGAKIAHLLASDLRRQILQGDLAAGQRLPSEPDLMAAVRVSRDTLREALRILESQSLLEIRRGRGGGAVVRRPGLASVAHYVALLLQLRKTTLGDLEEARLVIEPPAAEQLAASSVEEGLQHLAALHDDERAAEDDALSFVTATVAFDQAVAELSGNHTMGVIAGVLREIYAGLVYAAIGCSEPAAARRTARHVVMSHSAFLEAVRRNDGSFANKAWSDYLFTTSRLLVTRPQSRRPIDVVPLWRAQVSQAGGGQPQRMAAAVATEIRARIAEGRLLDGDRLASLPNLASEFAVSRPTLREALRILETESLIELRTGDRGGATIRHPSTQVATQLAGVILESRDTTLADFSRALRLVEPAMMELAGSRIRQPSLMALRSVESELARCTADTAQFVPTLGRARSLVLTAMRNPALAVIAEMLEWVRVAVGPAVTAGANTLPWVTRSNRKTHALFAELVTALELHNPHRAREAWAESLNATSPFAESSELGRRLVIDLIGWESGD